MKDIKISMTTHRNRASDHDLRMTIDDVFHITGRGVVAVGQIEAGIVTAGDDIEIQQNGLTVAQATVTGVEMFRKRVDVAGVGDHVGLLLDGVTREEIKKGMVAVAPNAMLTGFNGTPANPVMATSGTADGGTAFQFSGFNKSDTVDRLSDAAASAADHKDFTKGEEFRGLGFTDDSTPGHIGQKSNAIKGVLIVLLLVLAVLAGTGKLTGFF